MTRSIIFAAAVCALAGLAQAAMIPGALPGVTGKAHQQGDSATGDGSISRVLNGSGLTVGNPSNPATWLHNNRWQDNWQGGHTFTVVSPTLATRTGSAWFVADLGQIYADLDKMWLWNVREGSALNRGLQDFDVYYSNSPTVTPSTGSAYDFASGGWSLLGNYHVAQGNAANPPEGMFDLSGIGEARYIGLDILTNYGSNFRVGFAELEFTTPEPATLTALLLAAGGMGSYLRRRRRAA
jgi:hypothetical protein